MIERTIDLRGPDGNIFHVLATVRGWLRQLERPDLLAVLTVADCHSYAEALERCREVAERAGIALTFVQDAGEEDQ